MRKREHIENFAHEVWDWYKQHKRSLPWRDLTIKNDAERAYRVLVSEVMLQQTQVSRVVVIYKRFLREFPSIRDLANASNREIIMAWRGMGYNSRALRLRDAVREIVRRSEEVRKYENPSSLLRTSMKIRKCRIQFPVEMDELMSLPGIGHYTAAAIRNFAFHVPTPCVETNIRRVLHTRFFGPQKADGTWRVDDRKLLTLAEEVLKIALCCSRAIPPKEDESKGRIRLSTLRTVRSTRALTADWHAALMDYGSLALPKIKPKKRVAKKEPGRLVGSVFIPNRIFRGKIIEELRDAKRGLSMSELGRLICIDWEPKDHHNWLINILQNLMCDGLIINQKGRYALSE
ncbi:MAG TPA: hypothetical protein VJB82_05335 [Candidatus Peribacterales bacterium]|nr:hypothetical protein [Candidatus Peribacterales bacterium]